MRRCRVCGCLESVACVRDDVLSGQITCSWVEELEDDEGENLCSACSEEARDRIEGHDTTNTIPWRHPPRSITDHLAVA